MRVPVTLPSWIIEDGALPAPSVGDTVSYRVTFSLAQPNDLPTLCMQEHATALRTGTDSDGYSHYQLSFPTFTAAMLSKEDAAGDVLLTGRLIVDYELAVESEGRLTGSVVDRKLLIEEAALPNDPKALKRGFPIKYELCEIGAQGVQFVRPRPVLGSVWRRPTGLALTIDI